MFFVTSNFAKAKAAGRTLIVGRRTANVAKMTWREFGGCRFDRDVGGNVGGIEIILFVLERNGERFDRGSAEAFGFRCRCGDRSSRQLLLLRRRGLTLPEIGIVTVAIVHVIFILRLIASSSFFLIPIIALQHAYSLSNCLISSFFSQRLYFRRPLSLSSFFVESKKFLRTKFGMPIFF